MDQSETKAIEFLTASGFTNVVYEPDGNGTPDFAVNEHIAIEVRRLNQNYEGNYRIKGLEEDAQPLLDSVQKVIKTLGPSRPSENWYVSFSFRRPYGSRKRIARRVKSVLSDFAFGADRNITKWQLTPGFRLEVTRGGISKPTFFTMGGYVDRDNGGWLLSEMQRNLIICIEDKSKKRVHAKKSYAEWWLILVDHIGYGLPNHEDRVQLKTLVRPAADWDKIILLNPLDVACNFELQAR